MSQYKICVYAICKNEEQFVDRWMDAVSEADVVVVTDTGSTDKTVEKLQSRGAIVHEDSIVPWRFDAARNKALSYVPEDMDICVSNDLDEVFETGWRKKLESAWKEEYTRASYLFTWSYHADGSPKIQFPMEKIHQRHGFRWVHPVHEVLEYHGKKPDKSVWVEGIVLNHYPDLSKPRSQYLPLLELSATENPQDDRTMFWLGREYLYHNAYDKGITTLKKHLKLPRAQWGEERSASMRLLAHAYEAKGDLQEAKVWLYRALAECPTVREPHLALAKLGYREEDWVLTYAAAKKGLEITKSSGSYLVEQECWGHGLYDLGAIGAYHLGLFKEAEEYAQKAWEISPNEERLQTNLAAIQRKRNEGRGRHMS